MFPWVVNGTVLERESILPSKYSSVLYEADGAYCGITGCSLVSKTIMMDYTATYCGH
jgi:hypothetical protein